VVFVVVGLWSWFQLPVSCSLLVTKPDLISQLSSKSTLPLAGLKHTHQCQVSQDYDRKVYHKLPVNAIFVICMIFYKFFYKKSLFCYFSGQPKRQRRNVGLPLEGGSGGGPSFSRRIRFGSLSNGQVVSADNGFQIDRERH
jgi:hypothetical protein